MKRRAVIFALHAKHSDLEISQFLTVARSFFHKVRRDLESSDGIAGSFAKCRKHKLRSYTVRTLQFGQQVQDTNDRDPSKSIRAILRDLQVCECTIRRIVHEDIWYQSCVMHRVQFMSAQTRAQQFI